jgi:hypothetical protein
LAFNLDPGQITSFMRHVYTVAGTTAAIVGAASFMDQQTINTVLTAVHQIGDGVVSIATGVAALVPIVSGVYAAWSASHKSKLVAIATDPQTVPAVKRAVTAALVAPGPPLDPGIAAQH